MGSLTIRPATVADQGTIRRMIREASLNPMNLRWPHFLIAEEDGRTVGIGQVKQHSDGSHELASLAVIPSRQGAGIGSALVRELLAGHGHQLLHLTCRSVMVGYYQRFGFERVPRAEYPRFFARFLPAFNAVGRLFGEQIVLMRRNPPPGAPLHHS
jgi:N-acetylglutamate synthase-like GNAT family acetyltransferase